MAALGFRAEHVTKVYPDRTRANDGLTVTIPPGEILALLGPTGAGKSTLARQIVGMLRPTSGQLWLEDHDLVADPATARQLCSYLPQGQIPVGSFRVREAIALTAYIRGASRAEAHQQAERLIEALDLTEWRNRLVVRLDAGLQRLVGFALAAVRPGALVVLDEPGGEIDRDRQRLMRAEIRRLATIGCAVLLLTTDATGAQRSADRVAVIDRGRLAAEGSPAELVAGDRGRLRLELLLPTGRESPELPDWLAAPARRGDRLYTTVEDADGARAVAWARQCRDRGIVDEFGLREVTLEDAYVRLVSRPAEGEPVDGGASP